MSSCTVCLKKIRDGLLMCAGHWRQVPMDVQENVYRTYAVLQRTTIRDRKAWAEAIQAYRAASDEATRIANSRSLQSGATPEQGALL